MSPPVLSRTRVLSHRPDAVPSRRPEIVNLWPPSGGRSKPLSFSLAGLHRGVMFGGMSRHSSPASRSCSAAWGGQKYSHVAALKSFISVLQYLVAMFPQSQIG